jgi:hypothetical protein
MQFQRNSTQFLWTTVQSARTSKQFMRTSIEFESTPKKLLMRLRRLMSGKAVPFRSFQKL